MTFQDPEVEVLCNLLSQKYGGDVPPDLALNRSNRYGIGTSIFFSPETAIDKIYYNGNPIHKKLTIYMI